MLLHLWGDEAPPEPYIDLLLCKEVYHCLPSALDREDPERIAEHLACLSVEAEVERIKWRAR